MNKNSITYEQVGVLIEDLKSQFRVVAEGQTSLREELKRESSENFEFLNGEITLIKKAVMVTNKKLDSLEKRFNSSEIKLNSIETKVGSLETKVDSLEDKVDHIQIDVIDIKEQLSFMQTILYDHEHRIKEVEAI